jgi:UPF0755 protein
VTDLGGGPGGPGGPDGAGGPDEPDEPWDFVESGRSDPERRPVRQGEGTSAGGRTELRRRRVRRRRIVAGVGGAVLVIILAFLFWYEVNSHGLGPAGQREVVQVKPGESLNSIASSLAADHVIASTLAFRVSNLLNGSPTVIPGDYSLRQNETYGQVRAALAAGPNIYEVTIHSGLTLGEVAAQVDGLPGHADGAFSKAATSGAVHSVFSPAGSNNLEGMLGTGTYLVGPGESDTTLLAAMVHRFDAQATAAGLSASSAAALGYSPYQVIIAASIVEKEGYIPKNMPDVARVIYNRLASGTPLQMNATVLYSLGQDGGAVTQHDLQLQTPYNTYLNLGLTPTPICSPSGDALQAAVHPPAGGWIYFVLVKKDGTEAFSVTYAEQLANERLAATRGLG